MNTWFRYHVSAICLALAQFRRSPGHFFFNILVMASVSLAAIKIGGSMLNLSPWQSVSYAMIATVLFSAIGGFRGVLLTDFVLFIVSMAGAIGAAYFCLQLPEVGGLSGMIEKLSANPELADNMGVMSYDDKEDLLNFFIIPFAVVWWSIWYPGAEPGGGGYLVQRMLAAKNENHAVAATLFFNVAHYALRPWPWLLVALASLLVYPDIESIRQAVGNVLPDAQIKDDVAYSLMLTKLPAGWLGLTLASLAAAYMSTISTHLNWGASYIVNDVWKRFVRPQASARELVWMGRLSTVLLMVLAGIFALNYSLPDGVFPSLDALLREKVGPVLATRDFNIIPAMLHQRFKLASDKMDFPPVERRRELSDPEQPHNPILTAVLCREGLVPYADSVVGARRLRRATRFGAILTCVGATVGVLLAYYLTAVTAFGSLSPLNLLIFLITWLLPVWVLTSWVPRY